MGRPRGQGPVVPWLWTWEGYYLGINAGYSWGRSNTDAFFNDIANATSFGTNSADGMRGGVFGMQTGYNFSPEGGCGAWKRTCSSRARSPTRSSFVPASPAIRMEQ